MADQQTLNRLARMEERLAEMETKLNEFADAFQAVREQKVQQTRVQRAAEQGFSGQSPLPTKK